MKIAQKLWVSRSGRCVLTPCNEERVTPCGSQNISQLRSSEILTHFDGSLGSPSQLLPKARKIPQWRHCWSVGGAISTDVPATAVQHGWFLTAESQRLANQNGANPIQCSRNPFQNSPSNAFSIQGGTERENRVRMSQDLYRMEQ